MMMKENIAMLESKFKGIELTEAEKAALAWLVRWETVTVKSIVSAFEKLSKN